MAVYRRVYGETGATWQVAMYIYAEYLSNLLVMPADAWIAAPFCGPDRDCYLQVVCTKTPPNRITGGQVLARSR